MELEKAKEFMYWKLPKMVPLKLPVLKRAT